jgi:hypothetical protein
MTIYVAYNVGKFGEIFGVFHSFDEAVAYRNRYGIPINEFIIDERKLELPDNIKRKIQFVDSCEFLCTYMKELL